MMSDFPSIQDLLKKDEEIQPTIAHIHRILSAKRILQDGLADILRAHVHISNITDNYLCVTVSSSSVAYQLRHLHNSIIKNFQNSKFSFTEVIIRIDPTQFS